MIVNLETRARFACLFAGAVWGLFWLPLRAIGESGLHDLWTTVVYFTVPTILLLPVLLLRWTKIRAAGLDLQITAFACALALTCYSIAIVYTEVVRAMLLFYLTPIWSALLARAVLGEIITPLRVVSMIIAILGMLTIFGLGASLPVPRNIGDWLGLASGLFWAVAAVRLKRDSTQNSLDLTFGFFQWSLVIALIAALLIAPSEIPAFETVFPQLLWLIPIMLLMVIPGAFGTMWGPKFLNPGVVGLLFMTEIVVGAISAAIWAGEPFGIREITGVLLISGASLLEPAMGLMRQQSGGPRS